MYYLQQKLQQNRSSRWLRAHERKDGTVHPSAIDKYNQVKAAVEKRKMNGDGSSSQLEDLDSDALTEVFGPDVKGGVRGHASHVSKKRVCQALVAASILEKSVNPLHDTMNEMRNEMGQLSSSLKTIVKYLQHVVPNQSVEQDGSSSPKVGPNSMSKSPSVTMNVNEHVEGVMESGDRNVSSSKVSGSTKVDLLDNKRLVVASGYIVTGKEGERCHGRIVNAGEKKVFLEVVYDNNVVVWDAPQGDDCYRLGDYAEGGWLIWSDNRLQPAQSKN